MKAENSMLGFVEHTPADEAKVGHEFFPFPRVGSVAFGAATELHCDGAGVRPLGDALPKAVIAGPEYGAEHTMAGDFLAVPDQAHSVAEAIATRNRRQCDGFRSIPSHIEDSSRGEFRRSPTSYFSA